MEFLDENQPQKGDVVVAGLSGGVDSALTALMLQKKGCRVIGVTMSLWDEKLPEIQTLNTSGRGTCYSPAEKENIAECEKFCSEHDIEYKVIDVREKYRLEVLGYFKKEYRAGRTPNPCVMCNRFVKFGALLDGIADLNISYDYFCTGHYAKIVRPIYGLWGTDKKPCMVACAADISKDQTYFLYRLSSNILEKVRFPLAAISKTEVLDIAKKFGLYSASKKESQDFIPKEYLDIIFSDEPSIEGDIISLDGRKLGRHRGIEHYTVGQRRGLGVSSNKPLYVHSIDAKNNLVILSGNDFLSSAALIADNFVWPAGVEPDTSFKAFAKIRLASKPVIAEIEKYIPKNYEKENFAGTPYKITFNSPQRAVAPGQSVVLYDNGVIVGGGIINKTIAL